MQLLPHKVELATLSASTQESVPDGVRMIKAPHMWDLGHSGEATIVAVIDTGIDYTHPDLIGQVIGGKSFTGTQDFMDDNGHGTHVAGTIAAASNGTGVVGVAPSTKLIALKVLDRDGRGTYSAVINALEYVRTWVGSKGETVDIVTMSLAGATDSPLLHQSIKRVNDAGILIVCAAGNEGKEVKEYPAGYPEVVAVGAVNSIADMASFSNVNDEIDLVAPGVSVLSTMPGGGYAYMSGTSMAAPHVAGAAALIKQQVGGFLKRKITNDELFAYLCKRTTSLGFDKRQQGHGLLNLMIDSVMSKPRPENVDLRLAIEALSEMLIGIDDETIINSPEFWFNFVESLEGDERFRYISLLIRKFYVSKL